ncbi:unnamed protein product [Symbiodinium pilosum]|uniref:Uncharacterized protein n=1 Tax=Symbiodinium pilosum TaxID=2952 RepID=A0A812TXV7_SYMPI|nr:unnamed protein product [Symbiodinium pilosum]
MAWYSWEVSRDRVQAIMAEMYPEHWSTMARLKVPDAVSELPHVRAAVLPHEVRKAFRDALPDFLCHMSSAVALTLARAFPVEVLEQGTGAGRSALGLAFHFGSKPLKACDVGGSRVAASACKAVRAKAISELARLETKIFELLALQWRHISHRGRRNFEPFTYQRGRRLQEEAEEAEEERAQSKGEGSYATTGILTARLVVELWCCNAMSNRLV